MICLEWVQEWTECTKIKKKKLSLGVITSKKRAFSFAILSFRQDSSMDYLNLHGKKFVMSLIAHEIIAMSRIID
jgi:hypothetical protein